MRGQSSIILFSLFFLGLFFMNSVDFIFAECVGAGDPSLTVKDFIEGCTPSDSVIDPTKDMKTTVTDLSKTFIGFGALFAIGAIVWSGIQYTTSYGDEEKIKKAKTTGIYAITGLVLLLTAFSLVNMVVSFIYGLT